MKNQYTVNTRLDLIARLSDPNVEPFLDESYYPHLEALNDIVYESGESLEGNLFYNHLETDLRALSPAKLDKRRALALAGLVFQNILEIGFNAGHSALFMLAASRDIRLTYIDICQHKYTLPCFTYLKQHFPERIDLIEGNSVTAFPLLMTMKKVFDLYVIDGGHGIEIADTDLSNVIQYGPPGSVILFDDADFPMLRALLDTYLLSGRLLSISDTNGFLKNYGQMFFINNRAR